MDKALRDAVKRVGGFTPMGYHLGISAQAVAKWTRVPPLRVLDVERISGVPRSELRPDIYPPGKARRSA
jgi:DNA-binding transcriptional regulator YdaS (Cro superfamily)